MSATPTEEGHRPVVVVLGASGFVGSAVAAELAARPVRLRLVARRKSATPPGPVAQVQVEQRDLAQPGEVAKAVEGADAVVHLVAHIDGEQSWRTAGEQAEGVNVGVLAELLAACRTSTAGSGRPPAVVFGSTLQAGLESAHVPGTYAAQKLAAERLLHQADAEGVVRGAVLRLCTVFGRGPLTGATGRGVLTVMARRALAGEPLTLWHDGSVERDFLDVRDAATAFTAALEHVDRLHGRSWTVGTGHTHRLDAAFATVARLAAEHTGRPPVPVTAVEPPGYAATGDFDTPDSDPSAFREITGWRPRVGLEDGIATVVAALGGAARPGTAARTAGEGAERE